jgi:hypothetical protein
MFLLRPVCQSSHFPCCFPCLLHSARQHSLSGTLRHRFLPCLGYSQISAGRWKKNLLKVKL